MPQNPQLYVTTLLDIYKKYNELVHVAFGCNVEFVAALDKACRRFMNDNAVCKGAASSKSPELLARHADKLLKKSSKHAEEEAMEGHITDIVRSCPPPSLNPFLLWSRLSVLSLCHSPGLSRLSLSLMVSDSPFSL